MHYLDPARIAYYGEKIGFPAEATASLTETAKAITADEAARSAFDACHQKFFYPYPDKFGNIDVEMKPLSEKTGIPVETLSFLQLMAGCDFLKEEYKLHGISDALFDDALLDLRSKLLECHECRGIWGTFVTGWFCGLFRLSRFQLGRFQYAVCSLPEDYTLPDGRVLKAGRLRMECHIPSHLAGLTDEVRMDSYRKAYAFFKDKLEEDELGVISCSSWLLYERHKEFLPAKSNILKFMSDFDLFGHSEHEGFHDGWRVFGGDWGKPYEELPENSSLQKCYKQWLLSNNCAGSSYGLIVIDKNGNIINKK